MDDAIVIIVVAVAVAVAVADGDGDILFCRIRDIPILPMNIR